MKLPTGLLVLCLALTVSVRAEEVKTEAPAVKRELVWPEIKDPQALIDFAKAETEKFREKYKERGPRGIEITLRPEFAYLHSSYCWIGRGYMLIGLETHPSTWQVLIILADPEKIGEVRDDEMITWAKIEDTSSKYIKRGLQRITGRTASALGFGYDGYAIRWSASSNLDGEKRTPPVPLQLYLPMYPKALLLNGLSGETKVTFTVTIEGLASELEFQSTIKEFEPAVREVAKLWRFEPGVDIETRLPAPTRISLTVKFIVDDY